METTAIIATIKAGLDATGSAVGIADRIKKLFADGGAPEPADSALVLDLMKQLAEARVGQLEALAMVQPLVAELEKLRHHAAEMTNYRLVDLPGGDQVYKFDQTKVDEEMPPHHICPNCCTDNVKSILQKNGTQLRCPRCSVSFQNEPRAVGAISTGGRRTNFDGY